MIYTIHTITTFDEQFKPTTKRLLVKTNIAQLKGLGLMESPVITKRGSKGVYVEICISRAQEKYNDTHEKLFGAKFRNNSMQRIEIVAETPADLVQVVKLAGLSNDRVIRRLGNDDTTPIVEFVRSYDLTMANEDFLRTS